MTSSTLFVLFCFPNKVEIISWLLLSISLHEIYTTTWDYNKPCLCETGITFQIYFKSKKSGLSNYYKFIKNK